MLQAFEREIIDLHQFFMHWFNAEVENSDAVFARFSETMAPGFHIISPDGVLTDGPTLISQLRQMHGQRPGAKLWIQNAVLRAQMGDALLVTYEEWQENAGVTSSRLSSAILLQASSAPNGLSWLHVHETWFRPA